MVASDCHLKAVNSTRKYILLNNLVPVLNSRSHATVDKSAHIYIMYTCYIHVSRPIFGLLTKDEEQNEKILYTNYYTHNSYK